MLDRLGGLRDNLGARLLAPIERWPRITWDTRFGLGPNGSPGEPDMRGELQALLRNGWHQTARGAPIYGSPVGSWGRAQVENPQWRLECQRVCAPYSEAIIYMCCVGHTTTSMTARALGHACVCDGATPSWARAVVFVIFQAQMIFRRAYTTSFA